MDIFVIQSTKMSFRLLGFALLLMFYIPASYTEEVLSYTSSSQISLTKYTLQTQLEIDQRRKDAEEEVKKTINHNAFIIIRETKEAISAIENGQNNKASDAIEYATRKINILLSLNPEESLLPIKFKVKVIDKAPIDLKSIDEISSSAELAIKNKNYPYSRLLFNILRSEIHIHTVFLPLAIYSAELKKAARLLDQKNINEAKIVLITALNKLPILNQTLPIPLINARALIRIAQEKIEGDKNAALKLLINARDELKRTKQLGYDGNNAEYLTFNDEIIDLEKQIRNNKGKFTEPFTSLQNRLESFLKLQFQAQNYPKST